MNTAAVPPGPDLGALLSSLDERDFIRNALLTLLLWGAAVLLRVIVARALTVRGVSGEERRRFLAGTRNIVLGVLVLGTAAVWIDELKVFALSLVAVAAAIVIATKELIMCMGGTLLRTSSRAFAVGDRIEVGGVRGDVVDTTLLTTTLLEIGPGRIGHQRTGRSVVLPNSIFLAQPVVNESFTDAYVLHTFHVVVKNDGRWREAERILLEACAAELEPYAAEARTFFDRMSRERGLEIPTQDPRVLIEVGSPDAITLHCRLPTPARTKGRIEQAIVRRLLASPGVTAETSAAAPTARHPAL